MYQYAMPNMPPPPPWYPPFFGGYPPAPTSPIPARGGGKKPMSIKKSLRQSREMAEYWASVAKEIEESLKKKDPGDKKKEKHTFGILDTMFLLTILAIPVCLLELAIAKTVMTGLTLLKPF